MRKAFRTPANSRLEVLRGVSFVIEAGEMLAIVGASGAGKSTLLHVIGGLEEADTGEIRLGDVKITGARADQLARLRNREIGFVFQFHHLLPDLTAEENVALPLLINRDSMNNALTRARNALERVQLLERARHPVGQLSGGEQQRAALARALVHEPRLVLADEPTGNLDREVGDEIGRLLLSFCRERRRIVIIATHNEQLARTCDRTLYLRDGQLSEQEEEKSAV